jgi:DNA-binding CsgD family transcriptional regulator
MPIKVESYEELEKVDLVKTLGFLNDCLKVNCDEDFHQIIIDFAAFLGFEHVLYAYMKNMYQSNSHVHFMDLSNPEGWFDDYCERGYLEFDPVRIELEIKLARGERESFILWDHYDRELSDMELELIERRRSFGMEYGCSVYDNSETKDAMFLISFSSKTKQVDKRTEVLSGLIISHLMLTRKRLDMLNLVNSLSRRESDVAEWIVDGKTNWEISKILNISESTVKYHVKNIFEKLQVPNRQQAVSVLLAVRYLCL